MQTRPDIFKMMEEGLSPEEKELWHKEQAEATMEIKF